MNNKTLFGVKTFKISSRRSQVPNTICLQTEDITGNSPLNVNVTQAKNPGAKFNFPILFFILLPFYFPLGVSKILQSLQINNITMTTFSYISITPSLGHSRFL